MADEERELSQEEAQQLLGLLEEKPKKGRARVPPDAQPDQVRQPVTQTVSPGPAVAAKEQPKTEAKKPSKPVPEEQLRAGMRVICALTWRLVSFVTWLLLRQTHQLPELTTEEKAAWVEESMGFAKAIPSLMLIASVLGFPSYLFQLVAMKLQRKADPKLAEKTVQQKAAPEQPKLAAVPNS